MSSNILNATFPFAVLQLPLLNTFDLCYNMLTGPIPNLTWAFSATSLPTLRLQDNKFDLCSTPNLTFPNISGGECFIDGYCTGCTLSWSRCIYAPVTCALAPGLPPAAPNPLQLPSSPPPVAPPTCLGLPPPSIGSWMCNVSVQRGSPTQAS